MDNLHVEMKLIPSIERREYPGMGLGYKITTFWLVAVDQDSNIQWRKLLGKLIIIRRQPLPEMPIVEHKAGLTQLSLEKKVAKELTKQRQGDDPREFFNEKNGWEKFSAHYQEGEDPFPVTD